VAARCRGPKPGTHFSGLRGCFWARLRRVSNHSKEGDFEHCAVDFGPVSIIGAGLFLLLHQRDACTRARTQRYGGRPRSPGRSDAALGGELNLDGLFVEPRGCCRRLVRLRRRTCHQHPRRPAGLHSTLAPRAAREQRSSLQEADRRLDEPTMPRWQEAKDGMRAEVMAELLRKMAVDLPGVPGGAVERVMSPEFHGAEAVSIEAAALLAELNAVAEHAKERLADRLHGRQP
jgi:hypothetical protein